VTVIATGFERRRDALPRPERDGSARPAGTPFEAPPAFDGGDLDIPPFIRQAD